MEKVAAWGALPVYTGTQDQAIEYLSENQLNTLTGKFQDYNDQAKGEMARIRGKYFLIFLFLKYTGARISEVLAIDDQQDIDFRSGDVRLITLKRHNEKKKGIRRIVPVPLQVVNEIARYLAMFPAQKGKVFKIFRQNFSTVFKEQCKQAKIPAGLAHPHILRHTRAIDLLRAGVPVTIVQQLLGHSTLNTTAVYLRFSGQEAKAILKNIGMI